MKALYGSRDVSGAGAGDDVLVKLSDPNTATHLRSVRVRLTPVALASDEKSHDLERTSEARGLHLDFPVELFVHGVEDDARPLLKNH